MKLLEIKNNLVKLSYTETEVPVLGRFIVLASDSLSYVAQFVNLKSDTVNRFAIAKLLFTFTPDGVVDNYDGSIPGINSELSFLPSEELLNLLPVETPLKIGKLAQQDDILTIDNSVFERSLTVFVEKDSNKKVFISNCIRQLFQMKEKSVIVDNANIFEDYPKIVFTKDFKLPLNSRMIDYIFEYELEEVDAPTKAVIQDIFYAVQQYIKSLDFEFLPIDNFVDVVANQYKEIQMPELALLKNKLLKYRDANVFANTKEEVFALKEKLNEKNCSIIDLKDIHESLQKEVMFFIHSILESFDKYIYFFAPLTDENSDKKLLKQFLNNNHVFTTLLASSSYKYTDELKQHAQNMVLFTPQSQNNDFTAYNTFLNKLNMDECIVFGKLTQGIPFIVDMSDLSLDLTLDDVLGDRYQFIPASEELQIVKIDDYGNKIPVSFESDNTEQEPVYEYEEEEIEEDNNVISSTIPEIQQPPIEVVEDSQPIESISEEVPVIEDNGIIDEPAVELEQESAPRVTEPAIVEPVANILEEEPLTMEEEGLTEDDLELGDLHSSESLPEMRDLSEDFPAETFAQEAPLSEDDLDFIDDNQMVQPEELFGDDVISESSSGMSFDESYVEEQTPVVPVYPAESESVSNETAGDFSQGDSVTHPRYGRGVIEKIIKYGNKTLCSISFENVGRRLLDPSISELTKV